VSTTSGAPITIAVTPEQLRILLWGVATQRARSDVDPAEVAGLLRLLQEAHPPPPRKAVPPKVVR
jgi:hypothetical protein